MKKLLVLFVLFLTPLAYAAQKHTCCNYQETPSYGLYTNLSRVEFFGGVSMSNGDWKENGQKLEIGETGFTAGLAFVRNVLPWLTLGLDGNYAGFSRGDEVTLSGGKTVDYRAGAATALLTGRAYLFPKSMTRLYATAGVGGGYAYARERDTSTKENETYDSLDFAWMLGAGIEFDLDETVVFGAEGRYNWMALRSDMKDHFSHDSFDYWTIMLKLGIKF